MPLPRSAMTLDKLKVAARQHEQRDDWRAAIELYRQAIREAEGGSEGADPQLYNRIGDLEHKSGDGSAACEAWEQGALRYAEQGFFNNAIALCGKILRLDPSRTRTYLELARFHARKRVIHDVGQNLRTFLEEMTASGHADAAREALAGVGTEFAHWTPMQDLLDELLDRSRVADEPDEPVVGPSRGGEKAGGLVFLDTGPLTLERASDVGPGDSGASQVTPDVGAGLELDPVNDDGMVRGLEVAVTSADALDDSPIELDGLVDVDVGVSADDVDDLSVAGLVDVEMTAEAVGHTEKVDGFDTGVVLDAADATATGDAAQSVEGLEATGFEPPTEAIAHDSDMVVGGDLIFLDVPTPASEAVAPDAASDAPSTAGDDPVAPRVTAHELLDAGDRAGAIAALERSLAMYAEREEWLHALQVASELIAAEPTAIHRYQARVEMAARMQHPARLCEAYAELGDALLREGSSEKAIAVFRRVLELDDQHPRAREALRSMAPARDVPAGDDGFIDFGAMVNDDIGPRSTRMRTETTAISPDEDETFREALSEFKRALDQNLGVEEHQAHYDLGIAFREMGLMDEAISEFQKALRAPESRMRASEALGQVFFEQGRPGVAEAVLRGVERGPESDADKIAVLYWLGRSLEAQGRGPEAQGCYERVLAVDVGFHDASARATQLQSERQQ